MEAFDDRFFDQKIQDQGCKDIAAQLIEDNTYIDVNINIYLYPYF